MSLIFWRDLILWDVDVWREHLDQRAFAAIANDVMDVVRDVTGDGRGDQLNPYTSRILGRV